MVGFKLHQRRGSAATIYLRDPVCFLLLLEFWMMVVNISRHGRHVVFCEQVWCSLRMNMDDAARTNRHDLVEAMVILVLIRSTGYIAVYKKGWLQNTRLNLMVFAVFVISSVYMHRTVTLVCHGWNKAYLCCGGSFQTRHITVVSINTPPPFRNKRLLTTNANMFLQLWVSEQIEFNDILGPCWCWNTLPIP